MGKNNYSLLKVVLYVLSVYHILLGIFAFLPTSTSAKMLRLLFDMNVNTTPQLTYFGNLLGIYMFVFGIFMIIAASNPIKYRAIILVGAGVYLLRIVNRILFNGILVDSFGVSMVHFWTELILLVLFLAALFFLAPKEKIIIVYE